MESSTSKKSNRPWIKKILEVKRKFKRYLTTSIPIAQVILILHNFWFRLSNLTKRLINRYLSRLSPILTLTILTLLLLKKFLNFWMKTINMWKESSEKLTRMETESSIGKNSST